MYFKICVYSIHIFTHCTINSLYFLHHPSLYTVFTIYTTIMSTLQNHYTLCVHTVYCTIYIHRLLVHSILCCLLFSIALCVLYVFRDLFRSHIYSALGEFCIILSCVQRTLTFSRFVPTVSPSVSPTSWIWRGLPRGQYFLQIWEQWEPISSFIRYN